MPKSPPVSRYYDVKRDPEGQRYINVQVTGLALLQNPLLNKTTAFTPTERRELELEGLIPPHTSTFEEQKERTYLRYLKCSTDLEKHEYLRALQDRNEVLFYAILEDHLEEMLPIIYTPTVGEAVRNYSSNYRYPRGFTVSTGDIDRVEDMLENVTVNDVRMIVATDSSAILGIGDQGFGGMAISIGKLSLYTAAGGVGPDKTLPVELDVGTNRQDLIDDPLYLGVHHPRLTGDAYDEFLDAFVEAVAQRYPKAILQWEDFSRGTAFRVLERYRRVIPSFNDDIQGTGAMALAGLMGAARIKGEALSAQVFVIVGAGAAGIGVAMAIRQGLQADGLSPDEANARVFVVDRHGLLMDGQPDLEPQQESFVRRPGDLAGWTYAGEYPDLYEVIVNARATALLGFTGVPGLFRQETVVAMLEHTPRPIVFPLSNPSSHVEARPADLIHWTGGGAIIASGSPFPDVDYEGKRYPVGQGNNAFIFPGLGFGAVASRAREITDGMVMEAARTLAEFTEQYGERVYPPTRDLRELSIQVAVNVALQAIRDGVCAERRIRNMDRAQLEAVIRDRAWQPRYLPLKRA
ncbi:oxaloacetate-decarboxylating malate dehydrogenase [Deinococcus sp. HMF7620]|uniref:Oxaloacetate-decarboxylating malate dehydrogenase n=1 Tax=Deinococcus arboris TaxID=2682977 RepID=A0A7C9IAT0_9DEIO|nr:NAD-dependent malic enzyme [Deinococcus arboris]MVN86966.1 oxaloacetate-decarboxylating malate dehydrogenase [Deinococcus arboris]